MILWNGESSLPSGMLPTILDRAIGLPAQRWLDVDLPPQTLYAGHPESSENAGADASSATAAPN